MEIPIAASFKKAAAKASRTASMRRRQTRGLRHRRRPRQLLQCRRMMLECWMAVRVGASWAASLSCGTHYRNGTLPVPLKNAACPVPFFPAFFYNHTVKTGTSSWAAFVPNRKCNGQNAGNTSNTFLCVLSNFNDLSKWALFMAAVLLPLFWP